MKYLLLIAFAVVTFSFVQAQEVGQADIRITSFQSTVDQNTIHLVIDVKSDNDDDAWNARLVVLLPTGVKVPRGTLPRDTVAGLNCHAIGLTGLGYHSQVRCFLGQLWTSGPNSERHLEFDVEVVLPFTAKSFAAFVSSDVPDPLPANNFATAIP
jgi:hypothetical protein